MTVALMCIPFAGAGAGLFRPWRAHPARTFEVVPVQLPGREEQFIEEPLTSMDAAADLCAAQVRAAAGDDRPYALFGHSFGALLAYETSRRLLADGFRPPRRLIVSGAAAPFLHREKSGAATLPDDEFAARLQSLVGYDHASLHDPDLRELLLPVLRADMLIHDTYAAEVPDSATAPALPLSVLRGESDALVSRADADQWSAVTSADAEFDDVPGDHMYFTDAWPALWDRIDGILAGKHERQEWEAVPASA
ncbi:thioesterase II family protein [Streptomyces lavendofoliae]|uniref:thioesterase II family protein n=1 Tax=Streptomyces lavendofoliae TaxID=67314 RepID=UPI003D8AF81A